MDAAVPADRTNRRHRGVLAVALLALLAASVGLTTAASAAEPPAASSHQRQSERARAWTAAALRAAALAAPVAASGPRAGVVAPRAARDVTGPALLFSQVTLSGSTIGRLDFSTAASNSVITSPTCVTLPRLSPDGNTIVAITYTGPNCASGTSTVATFDASSGALKTTLDSLTASALDSFAAPSWSPDGTTILYTRWNTAGPLLYKVAATGGTPSELSATAMLDGVWSPDGTKIVAADFASDKLDIINGTGTLIKAIPVPTAPGPESPAWSPDGTKISFSYDKAQAGGHNYGIAVINYDGTGLHPLASTTADVNTNAFSSTWSDDGTQIFYDAFGQTPAGGTTTVSPAIYVTDAAAGAYRATVKPATPTTVFVDPFFVLSNPPATPADTTYTPITPVRVQAQTPVGAGGTIDVQIGGANGIPSAATAVTLNLTGVAPTSSTWLTAYPKPDNTLFPVVSNLNLVAGQTAAIAVQVTLSSDGFVRIRNNAGTTGVIVDVSGYFTPGRAAAGYVPLTAPFRAMDAQLGSAASRDVDLTSVPGAPSNAVAVVLNLTAALPTASTWLSVVPTTTPFTKPTVSNLNLPRGTNRANLVTAKIGNGGKVTVYNAVGSVRTIVDVVGFYTTGGGQSYYPLNPMRILDTRDGTRTALGSSAALGQGRSLDLPTYGTIATATGITRVPSWATAVAFNLTGVTPTVGTFLSVVPTPGTTNTSSVNLPKGGVVPNLVISSVGTAAGAVRIKNAAGAINVVADLAGFYGPPPV